MGENQFELTVKSINGQFPNAHRAWLSSCVSDRVGEQSDHKRVIRLFLPQNLAIAPHLVYRRPIRTDTLGGNVDGTGNGLRFWHCITAARALQ
jgi:hypothetical protein